MSPLQNEGLSEVLRVALPGPSWSIETTMKPDYPEVATVKRFLA